MGNTAQNKLALHAKMYTLALWSMLVKGECCRRVCYCRVGIYCKSVGLLMVTLKDVNP